MLGSASLSSQRSHGSVPLTYHGLLALVLAHAKPFARNSIIRKEKNANKMHIPQTSSSSLERGISLPWLPRKRRIPLVQSGQPLHFFHKHFFAQSCGFVGHHDLHTPGVGLGVGAGVGVTEHAEHPLQLFQLHFLDQGLELVEQNDLQTPGVGLGVGAGVGITEHAEHPSHFALLHF